MYEQENSEHNDFRKHPSPLSSSFAEVARERVRPDGINVHRHHLPLERGAVPREECQLVVPCAAHGLTGILGVYSLH